MSYSIQDLDSRVGVLERKIDFILENIPVIREERSIIDPTQTVRTKSTLKDLYYEITTYGAPANGTESDTE